MSPLGLATAGGLLLRGPPLAPSLGVPPLFGGLRFNSYTMFLPCLQLSRDEYEEGLEVGYRKSIPAVVVVEICTLSRWCHTKERVGPRGYPTLGEHPALGFELPNYSVYSTLTTTECLSIAHCIRPPPHTSWNGCTHPHRIRGGLPSGTTQVEGPP